MSKLLKPIRSLLGSRGAPAAARTPAPGAASSPLAPGEACGEVSLQHLWSDAPNALKFQIDRNLLPFGETRAYASAEEAADAPLARAIFEAGGIESVTLESIYITVLMQDDADWEALLNRVPDMIRKFFAAGGSPLAGAPAQDAQGAPAAQPEQPRKRYSFGFKEVQGRPREEQMTIVQELFDREVNPAVSAHGGYFTLLDIQDNNVYVELGGGCQGCGMANVTLRQGVEARLREVLPEMAALIDTTDHAAGNNPYYQSGKK